MSTRAFHRGRIAEGLQKRENALLSHTDNASKRKNQSQGKVDGRRENNNGDKIRTWRPKDGKAVEKRPILPMTFVEKGALKKMSFPSRGEGSSDKVSTENAVSESVGEDHQRGDNKNGYIEVGRNRFDEEKFFSLPKSAPMMRKERWVEEGKVRSEEGFHKAQRAGSGHSEVKRKWLTRSEKKMERGMKADQEGALHGLFGKKRNGEMRKEEHPNLEPPAEYMGKKL